jgi:hypothetical protein
VEARELTPDEVTESLREDIGLSGQAIDRWVESGGLAGATPPVPAPPSGQRLEVPPSQRHAAR